MAYVEWLYASGKYGIVAEAYAAKRTIMEQARRYNKVYLIKSGIAKCYLSNENGRIFIQEFLGEGMEFGELEVFNEQHTICSVATVTPLEVYTFSHAGFKNLLETDAKFNTLVLKALADKIRYKAPRHSYQHGYPIEDNIVRLQANFPDLITVIPKKDIANYIGITTRSLNRALRGLKKRA